MSEGYEVPTELPGSTGFVYIIFALPDYSSEVIERHQNLFYGRLTNLALEFDVIYINNG